jgi:hypothetical protein
MYGSLYIRCIGDREEVLINVKDYLKLNSLENRCFSGRVTRLPGTKLTPGLPDKSWQDCIGIFNLSNSEVDTLKNYLIEDHLADRFDYLPLKEK